MAIKKSNKFCLLWDMRESSGLPWTLETALSTKNWPARSGRANIISDRGKRLQSKNSASSF